jgi:hypothetical protein
MKVDVEEFLKQLMVVLLTLRAECSLLTSKPAHLSPYLPTVKRLGLLVNWVNIRTNRTQGSDFGLKTWTRRIPFASDRFGSGSFKAMNGNLYCIFSTKE